MKVRLLAGIERFVVEAERGGLNVYEDLGDLAVDDFHVTSEPCQSSENKPHFYKENHIILLPMCKVLTCVLVRRFHWWRSGCSGTN